MGYKKPLAFVLACIFFGSTLYAVHASAFSALLVTGGKPNTFKTEPFVEFDASPKEGEGPLTVLFTSALRNSDAKLYEYDFDGDGQYDFVGKDYRTSFTYKNPGTYVASLKVTDEKGKKYESSSLITVSGSVLQTASSSGFNPWEEEGIQPYKQYFKNMQEYVDPATGYLTIANTDLYLPGRGGLDLVIKRSYTSGAVYYNETPKSEKYHWADVGNGWMIDFPWIENIKSGSDEDDMCPSCREHDNDPPAPEFAGVSQLQTGYIPIPGTSNDTASGYIYLGNGAKFKVTGLPFANHQRIHFTFVKNGDDSYDLIFVDGTRYHFGQDERLLYAIDRTGNNSLAFYYNQEGKFDKIVDTLGREVLFTYSGGKLSSITSGGRTVTYSYNGDNLISATDPAGRTTFYEYNTGHSPYLVSKIIYPTGGSTSYAYKKQPVGTSGESFIYRVIEQNMFASGPVKKITYEHAEDIRTDDYGRSYYSGNLKNCMVKVYDPQSVMQTVYYAIAGVTIQSRTMSDGAGTPLRKTEYAYNKNKEIMSAKEYIRNATTPTFTTYQNYDHWGNVIAQKDSLGHSVFYSYANSPPYTNNFKDVNDNLVAGLSNSFYTNYIDPNVHNLLLGQAMFQEISSGNKIEIYYDYTDGPPPPPPTTTPPPTKDPCPNCPYALSTSSQSGLLIQTKTLHNGWIFKDFSSDAYGNIISVTEHPDARSITTTFSYDPQYQAYLTSITKTLNNSPVTSSFSYDFATGDVISITDMKGYTSSYAYDILGRITSVTFPDGKSKTASYDDSARTVTISDERGAWVKKYFDELGRMTMVQNAEGQESYVLNYMGKVSTKIDPLGRQYAYEYDSLGRTTKATNPDGTYQRLLYDDPNFMVTSYDEKGNRKDYLYDFNQQLKTVKEYVGSSVYTTSYAYDGVGNMKSVTDAKNQTTSYTYDDLNRLTKTTYADGTSSSLTYDNAGNILSKKDQKNQTITYAYDEMYRLTRITYPDGNYVSYAYDNNGNRLEMTDPVSQTTYTYDVRNRLVTETKTVDGVPYTTNYGYDDASNLSNLTYPDGFSLASGYDALNRVSQISGFASYAYNPLSQITNVNFANGVQTAYTYDERNRPTKILTNKDSNTILDLNYAYDPVGNITEINNGATSETYGYDALDRLISAQLPPPQGFMQSLQAQPQQEAPQTMLLSETTTVTSNPDGTSTATISSVPQNFNDNGVFKPIDLNIVSTRGAPYEFQNTSNTFKSYFKSSTKTDSLFKFEAKNGDGAEYSLGKMTFGKKKDFENPRDSTPIIEGSTITYPSVYSGVDIKYEILPLVLKESIILNSPPPLKKETLDFEGTLKLNNVYYREEEGSYLFFDRQTNMLVFYIPPPFVSDAEGWIADATMTLKQKGKNYLMTVSIPKKFVNNATYPVTIDPSFNSEAALDGYSTTKYYCDGIGTTTSTNKTDTKMYVGQELKKIRIHDEDGSYYETYSYTYRSFVSFDTSSLPDDATILSSYLNINAYSHSQSVFDNLVYNYNGTFEGNIMSAQYFTPGYHSLHVSEANINKTGRTQYSIKSNVEGSLCGSPPSSQKVTWTTGNSTAPPKLEITFNRPPAPSNLQITTLPDDNTPSFSWTYQDPEGDVQTSFQFQISSDSSFAAIVRDSGEVQSGEPSYTEPTALQNATYFARVKVKDSRGVWSAWSSSVMFSIDALTSSIIDYTYDQTGNRTKKNDTGVTTTYNYNPMNQLVSMTETNGSTSTITNYDYDLNGNLTQKQIVNGDVWNYVYDYENRLIEVKKNGLTIQKNWYDGDGKRIKKQENGETVVYIYVGIQVIYEKVVESGKETKYIGRVAKIEKVNGNETITYFHTDHLGSTRAITDSSGNLTATLQYDPFGEVGSGSSDGVRYTYTGKEQDATGLYYYGARFYDPKVGRFITRDPLAGKINNPQTQNRYIYTLNNPLKFIDPTGENSMSGDNVYYSQTGSRITIHLSGGKTIELNLNNPRDLGFWAGYCHYGAKVPASLGGIGLPPPGTSISSYQSPINSMSYEQAQSYAKNQLGMSPSDAEVWAKGYIEGWQTALDKINTDGLDAYVADIGGLMHNIEGWEDMCWKMALEIIAGYEWCPFPIEMFPYEWLAWQLAHIRHYLEYLPT